MKVIIALALLMAVCGTAFAFTISEDALGRTKIKDGDRSYTCTRDIYGNIVCR